MFRFIFSREVTLIRIGYLLFVHNQLGSKIDFPLIKQQTAYCLLATEHFKSTSRVKITQIINMLKVKLEKKLMSLFSIAVHFKVSLPLALDRLKEQHFPTSVCSCL